MDIHLTKFCVTIRTTNNYINEGERIIKSLILTAVIAILVFIGAEGARAWSVTVKNNDTAKITVIVFGYHLFWAERECDQDVEAGAHVHAIYHGGYA